MLIDIHKVKALLEKYNISVRGILHVGAHECEEKSAYNNVLGIPDNRILWVDANPRLVNLNTRRGIPNCFFAALDEKSNTRSFYITNNGQSSSLLPLGSHEKHHPHIHVSEVIQVNTETLSNFFHSYNLDPKQYNIWNFDIQGSELHVFRGSQELLQYADVIYTEVNQEEIYRGCGLLEEMDALLLKYGLKRIDTNMTEYNWGDAIYIRC